MIKIIDTKEYQKQWYIKNRERLLLKAQKYRLLYPRNTNKCIDCGIAIYTNSKRCRKCANIGILNPMHNKGERCWLYKDGRTKKGSKCLDCGKKISYQISRCWECRNKYISVNYRGAKSHMWKGGRSKENTLIRLRREFRVWRKEIYERDNYTCQMCDKRSGVGQQVYLHPHHIKSFAKYPELRFEVSNGLTLCKDCHMKLHNLAKKVLNVR